MDHSFRPFDPGDRAACLALFDANCPAYFAPNERADYIEFLDRAPAGYEVCELDGSAVAAFGLIRSDGAVRLNWIMLAPASQGRGIGSAIMQRVVAAARSSGESVIHIAASQKSAPFFARFGAAPVTRTPDGWGPGMDRIDMELGVRQ